MSQYLYNEVLAPYTSWHVGGAVDRLFKPKSLLELIEWIPTVPSSESLLWLGLGSNLLVRDGGVPGTAILTQEGLSEVGIIDETLVRAEAGVPCAQLAKFCAKNNLLGLEFFAGIPGTVGGALRMNAGAYGSETWDFVDAVEILTRGGQVFDRKSSEFTIGYRDVALSPQEAFVASYFRLHKGNGAEGEAKIRELLKWRKTTQPIGQFNGGSVFRNPKGNFAARLIETAGLKGLTCGDAAVSEKHANFIINQGKATASDIETLIQLVQTAVAKKWGVELQTEVHCVGVWG